MFNAIFFAIDLAALFVATGMAYYAFQVLGQMKSGFLEKSWKYMTIGALVIAVDVVVLTVQLFGESSPMVVEISAYIGGAVAVIGGFFILLGFRAHYQVWNPAYPKPKKEELKELT